MYSVDVQELEAAVLKLDPKSRARLAEKLLNSLEELSEAEVDRMWAEEAERRDAKMDADPDSELSAEDVFHHARSRFK